MTTRAMAISVGLRGALAILLAGLLGTAQAALFEDEEARRAILDLRQRVEQANSVTKGMGEENAQLRRALLDLQGQIESLKSELSKSRGAQEQLARDLSELQVRQKDLLMGLEDRLRRSDERMQRLVPVKVSLDGAEFMAEPAEKREYDAALDIFRNGDFVAAQAVLGAFVNRYRLSGYVPSALFWLGNAQYANKDYKEALANFQRMLKSTPTHPRAPEAMLAIANVQIELKDLKSARKSLDDLIKAHPTTETAATARDRLARLR
jgi:tol-pal system protein YbgF